jgi:hypothetical protein
MSAGLRKQSIPTTAIAADGATNGDQFDFQSIASEIVVSCVVSSRTDGTYTFTLQESPDDGTTWIDVAATAGLTADGTTLIKPTVSVLNTLRVKCDAASVTSGALISATIHYSNRGK